jgi:hypothetical protein
MTGSRMRDRFAAQSVIEEFLRQHELIPRRTRFARRHRPSHRGSGRRLHAQHHASCRKRDLGGGTHLHDGRPEGSVHTESRSSHGGRHPRPAFSSWEHPGQPRHRRRSNPVGSRRDLRGGSTCGARSSGPAGPHWAPVFVAYGGYRATSSGVSILRPGTRLQLLSARARARRQELESRAGQSVRPPRSRAAS